ncbi:MAG: papain-like cysteine protease family protein [Ramlibacter sp.]
MKISLNGLSVEKQSSSQFCWVAASFAVIRYFRFVVYDQLTVSSRLGVNSNTPGNPGKLLSHFGVLDETMTFDAPLAGIEAQQRAASLFQQIAHTIQQGLPVVIGVKTTDTMIPFAHALVVCEIDDQARTIKLLDPARPTVPLVVNLETLLTEWTIYPNTPHDYVTVYSRYYYFTKKPQDGSKPQRNVRYHRK